MTLSITDHAVLRYIERKYAVDIAALRRDLSAQLVRAARSAETIGIDRYAITHDGMRFIVENNAVVTTLTIVMKKPKLEKSDGGL